MRELFREFAAARQRATDDYRRDMTLAWHTVYVYIRTKSDKRMPTLKSLTSHLNAGPSPRQNAGQLRAALSMLSEQYAIPLRSVGASG